MRKFNAKIEKVKYYIFHYTS